MIYCFDLDGTICTLSENNNYENSLPFVDVIKKINELYEDNIIKIFTARGASSGKDWTELTKKQLQEWGLNYHELIMNKKPSFDLFIDDKAINAKLWREQTIKNSIKGIIAGSFDVIHPGYIRMFKEAKFNCEHLTIALHSDPTIEKNNKIKPILSLEERKEILLSIRYIDDVKTYKTEEDLKKILEEQKYNVRILGDDYKEKMITGENLCDKIVFIDRKHGWSTSEFKKRIYKNYKEFINK